jgi:excisionase family DNA binding protein
MDRPLTAPEAAELLGYHQDHLRRLLKAGTVKGEQVSGRWLIPRQEVERIKGLQGPGGRLPRSPGEAEP